VNVEDVSRSVARQYEAYAYPQPFTDLDVQIDAGYREQGDPQHCAPLIWPEGRPKRRMRILSAGCGTVQAAYLAHTQRDHEVIGVDLSSASLGHQRFLQERHGLHNLRLYQGDLRDIAQVGDSFDHIVCTGVLHHMADPDAGLAALARVLAPQGTLLLMVYGATARAGVYMVQDALRRLQVPQSPAGVAFARELVAQLPAHHYAQWYVGAAAELAHDAAFVDTFLHQQDRAYTVPELLDLVEAQGLTHQAWVDNALYYPEAALARFSPAVVNAVTALPEREQWAVVEMLTQRIGMHTCVLRRSDDGPQVAAHAFGTAAWDVQVPHWAPGLKCVQSAGPLQQARYHRAAEVMELGSTEAALLDLCDGRRNLREILAQPWLASMPAAERARRGEQFFARLWRLGHLMFSRPAPVQGPIPP
jgi:SAM-dependent methyltransferase